MTTLPPVQPFQPPFEIADGYLSIAGQRLDTLIERFGKPCPIRVVNLDGGFGIPNFTHEKPLELAPIQAALAEIAVETAQTLPAARLCLELGRYLVSEAGMYVARVLDKIVSRGHTFLVVDGGLHHHLAATGNFAQATRRKFTVAIGGKVGASQQSFLGHPPTQQAQLF